MIEHEKAHQAFSRRTPSNPHSHLPPGDARVNQMLLDQNCLICEWNSPPLRHTNHRNNRNLSCQKRAYFKTLFSLQLTFLESVLVEIEGCEGTLRLGRFMGEIVCKTSVHSEEVVVALPGGGGWIQLALARMVSCSESSCSESTIQAMIQEFL